MPSYTEFEELDAALTEANQRIDGVITLHNDDVDEIRDDLYPVVNSAVRVTAQTFTEAQKAQARSNIGAVSADDVADLVTIDATLTQSGEAADAAATGFAVVAISESVSDVAARIGGLSFSVDADGILNVTYEEVGSDADN